MTPVMWLKARRSLVFSLSDAAVSSFGNLAVTWSCARALNISDFGYVSLIMIVGLLMQGIVKARLVDAYTLAYSSEPAPEQRGKAKSVVGAAVACALPLCLAVIMVSMLLPVDDSLRNALLALAVGCPALIAQDSIRWIAHAQRRQYAALVNTVVWTCVTLAVVAILWVSDLLNTWTAVLAWSLPAAAGALIGALLLRVVPVLRGLGGWLRRSGPVGNRSLLDYGLTQIVGFGGGILISLAAGPAVYGVVRIAQLPMAPIQILITGGIAFIQPALVIHVASDQFGRALRLARNAALSISSVVLVLTIILTIIPRSLMIGALGPSWDDAYWLVWPLALGLVASAVAASYGPLLRALGKISVEVRLKSIVAPVSGLLIYVGSFFWGATGGVSAQAISTIVLAILIVNAARRTSSVKFLNSGGPG